MMKLLIVLGTILAATAGSVILAESKVNIMKEEQSQNEEIATGKEQKSEDEEIDLKKLMLYSYLLQMFENNNGTKMCTFCEYFLLTFVYSLNIDDTITNSVTKKKMKKFLEKMCTKIPSSLEGECEEFVNIYGDAVMAVSVQGIDPSQICPMLNICPSEVSLNVWDKASKFITKKEDKAICNICLLALSRIYNVINKTEDYIEIKLYKVCNDLPHVLTDKCIDFVETYSEKLSEMFLDLSPLKVCIHLRLCDPHPKRNNITEKDGEILTSEILEYPSNQVTNILKDSVCTICEFAMHSIAKKIGNNKTQDRIEKVVHDVCYHLPKTVAKDCNKFVDDYADAIINILSQEVSPKEACTLLSLCKVSMMQIRESVSE